MAAPSEDTAGTPVQHTEHAPRDKPLLLPGQSLQFPWACASLKELTAIFAPIEEACTPLTAGPKVKDKVSKIANSRRTTLNDMKGKILIDELDSQCRVFPKNG
jgi:hypothetical protein